MEAMPTLNPIGQGRMAIFSIPPTALSATSAWDGWETYIRVLAHGHLSCRRAQFLRRYLLGYLLDKCVNKQTNVLDQGPAWWGNLETGSGPRTDATTERCCGTLTSYTTCRS